jgi:glyoxylase-like metal-dependent hydrolase (beta-lactamase superfamily II)
MKSLHRPDLFCWSVFDAERNVDFHGLAWIHPEGNVLVDPMPMSDHDLKHLENLGGAAWIVVTNSDHTRASAALAERFGAKICGPKAEEGFFKADRWLKEGDVVVSGLWVVELAGSKTPGELALVLEGEAGRTLITGDLVRAHRAGSLMLLPDAKLKDKSAALESVKRLAGLGVEAVLVGDGWQVFAGGTRLLEKLC